MRTTERLTKLRKFITDELCTGRQMKAPGEQFNIADIRYQEPCCYLAWAPSRIDKAGQIKDDPVSVLPGIIIMPNQAHAKYMEEKRFDRYNNVHRPPDLGQHLAVSILFCVYEPGIRLPGFVESVGKRGDGLDMSLIQDGTEEGLFTLLNWMDDCMEALLREKHIPETDLFLEESTMTYSLYTDQEYVVDRRPCYYGFVNVSFGCYADTGVNPATNAYLV